MYRRKEYSEVDLTKKREEAERRARRGEMDLMQEYTFGMLALVGGGDEIKRIVFYSFNLQLSRTNRGYVLKAMFEVCSPNAG